MQVTKGIKTRLRLHTAKLLSTLGFVLEQSRSFGYFLLVRVFKHRWFSRFAAREGIQDSELKAMVNILEAGQADANLGGGVYKVRVARAGAGKSGGYRVILFFRQGNQTLYAVKKGGRKTAVRVLDSESAAQTMATEWGKGHYVETRVGEFVRCQGYCSCCEFCNFYRNHVAIVEQEIEASV
jgi:hypothetical protein